jgi:polysaccharide biosynthesis transport protein
MASSTLLKLPPAAAQFSPLSLARMLWLHKLTILLVWLLVSGITVAVVYMLPAQYTAEVQILVYPQEIPEKLVQSVVNTNIQDRLATISAEILSAPWLQKVIDDFGLYKKESKTHIREEILQMMRQGITIKVEKGWSTNQPGAFRVAYTGDNPAIVAQVANRVAELYIEENMRTRENQVGETTEFLGTLLDDAKKRLDVSEAAISAYKQKHNGELPEQVAAIAANVARLQGEGNGNRDAIARAEGAKLTLQNTLELSQGTLQALLDRPDAPAPVAAAPAEAAEPKSVRVAKPSELLEVQLAGLQARGLGDQHPQIKALKTAIAAAKVEEEKIEQEAANAPPAPAPVPAPEAPKRAVAPPVQPVKPAGERPDVMVARSQIRTIQAQIDNLDKDIATRTADQDRLAGAINEAQGRLSNVPVREQEIAQIMRDHANIEGEYQALLSKNSTAKASSDMEFRQKSERFVINDPARVPEQPVSPNRVLFNLLGSIGGLVLGVCMALGKEFHQGRILGAWELPEDVLVLARVPQIKAIRNTPKKQGWWTRWSRTRRIAVVSGVLLPLLGLLAAAKVYLVR